MSANLTFCSNYVDLTIIFISIGISTRYNQINNRLLSMKGKVCINRL